MSWPDSKVTHILQEKIVKFELGHQKKVLDECSSTLEFFLVKYLHISILVSLYLVLWLRIKLKLKS